MRSINLLGNDSRILNSFLLSKDNEETNSKLPKTGLYRAAHAAPNRPLPQKQMKAM
jgi:hypothetical protein